MFEMGSLLPGLASFLVFLPQSPRKQEYRCVLLGSESILAIYVKNFIKPLTQNSPW